MHRSLTARNFMVLAGLAITGMSAGAQQKITPSPAVTQTQYSAVDTQWEYLVVTYGKTVFGSPEKTLAYRSVGLVATAQEANEIQRSLDVLGRFGWEIITIVGAIGGDQQIVFKRRYDRVRVASEATAILKGKEIYLKDLVDILEREKRVRDEAAAAAEAERSKPRLIELDAQDQEANRKKITAERLAIYAAALASLPWGPKATLSVRADKSYTYVELNVDVTEQALQDGNSYRKSEVTSWLKKTVIPALKASTNESWGYTSLKASASISFQGKAIPVGEEKANYSQYTRWTE